MLRSLLVALAAMVCLTACSATPTRLARLRCESLDSPLCIDTRQPRLSWIMESSEPGQRQTAYQILAATSPDRLKPGQADLWDTGRVNTDRSLHLEYAGKPLSSNQQVFWTARAWDRAEKPTPFSPPATFTTSLLSPGDWQAQWITGPTGDPTTPTLDLSAANWIWYPEPAFAKDKRNAPAGVTRYLRHTFRLPAGADAARATLHVTADNESETFVNGRRVGRTDEWERITSFKVGPHLKPDADNTILVRVFNGSDRPNPAGAIAKLTVPTASGKDFTIHTDASWQSAETDAGPWKPAAVVAKYGDQPWRDVLSSAPHPPMPIFRKTFTVDKPVRRALLHASGLGHYKAYLNGRPVGDHFTDPAWSNYEKTVYYNTFDVTRQLKRGPNALGAMLGKSYYSTKGDRRLHGKVFDRPPVFIAQLELQYADGSTARVATDSSWRYARGPYVHASFLGGPTYDARQLPPSWNAPTFDDSTWKPAPLLQLGTGNLELGTLISQTSPPMKTFEEFSPASVTEPAPGRYVYAFPQNASATIRLKVKGRPGQTLRLTYAEQRHGQSPHKNDGTGLVDQSGIRSPNYFEYICNSNNEETWFYDLFYSGFQYMELTGAVPQGFPNPDDKPVVTQLTSVHVRSAAPIVGTFECSNDMIERIDDIITWSVRSNLAHVLTDCPHREKMGWLEVPHLMWDSMAGRYDLSTFGPKVCQDIKDAQEPGGKIPTVAPAYGDFPGPFQYTPEWGAAGVLIPWQTYQTYGDLRTLGRSYPMMRGFVDYMRSTCKDGLVPAAGLGDWYDYVPGQNPGPSKLTPPELSAMAIFYECTTRLADAADLLGHKPDVAKYRQLAADIRADFNQRYYQGNGVYKNTGSCQTANAMALVTGLAPEDQRLAVLRALVEDIQRFNYQQTSGDVGFHYLVRALADDGQFDTLYRILDRKDLGSYAFLVSGGWTTLPEAWDAHHHSSMNHCMLGHIQEFFTRNTLGIQPLAPAYKRILIHPTPHRTLTQASGSLDTPYGPVTSSWKQTDATFSLDLTLPPNTTAQVRLPDGATTEVASGRHHFTVPTRR